LYLLQTRTPDIQPFGIHNVYLRGTGAI
jgi:hypothetical protein